MCASLEAVAGILQLFLAFRTAHILRSDIARTGRLIGISGMGVFFFGCLYLQHVMNAAGLRGSRGEVAGDVAGP